jgi:uncharacterized caspase-like protein
MSPIDSQPCARTIWRSNYPDAESAMADVTAGADALANILRTHGFLVIIVRDATRAGMTEAVDRLKAAARPGSVVLIYFGGFAVQSQGQNYMISVDAKIWQERDVRRDGEKIERTLSDLPKMVSSAGNRQEEACARGGKPVHGPTQPSSLSVGGGIRIGEPKSID